MIDDEVLSALLQRFAPLRAVPLVPSLRAFHADDELPLWMALEDALGARTGAPFFAVAWPGAQALARVIVDGAVDVRGARVVEVGCGSGLAAVAAAMTGAAVVRATDTDPLALAATRLLARAHGVVVDTDVGDASNVEVAAGFDVIIAGDVVYNVDVGASFAGAIRAWVNAGKVVVVADSGRPFFDKADLVEFAAYDVEVPRAVEGVGTRTVRVYRNALKV